jgi:hypothetical protein
MQYTKPCPTCVGDAENSPTTFMTPICPTCNGDEEVFDPEMEAAHLEYLLERENFTTDHETDIRNAGRGHLLCTDHK